MKKLIAIFLFLVIATPSHAEWEKVSSADGLDFYVDFGTVKKNNGYVYYWEILNYLKPSNSGTLSVTSHQELDCDIPVRNRYLSFSWYKQPMGKGAPAGIDNKTGEWKYHDSGSSGAVITKKVCAYAEDLK